jgi:protein tyrosine phosphatase (PTP) superfamily phosphohydrolase (DUF442 family)
MTRHPRLRTVLFLLAALALPATAQAAPGLLHRAGEQLKRAKLQTEAAVAGLLGRSVGYLELLGMRFPVKAYQAQVSPELRRGSRLDREGMRQLAAQGYRTVVSLTAERNREEEAAARECGVHLERIRIVDNTAPSLRQMKRFLSIMSHADGPVYVHCEAGKGRTGTAVAVYRMAMQGWPSGRAIAEAHRYGLSIRSQTLFLRSFGQALRDGQVEGYPR